MKGRILWHESSGFLFSGTSLLWFWGSRIWLFIFCGTNLLASQPVSHTLSGIIICDWQQSSPNLLWTRPIFGKCQMHFIYVLNALLAGSSMGYQWISLDDPLVPMDISCIYYIHNPWIPMDYLVQFTHDLLSLLLTSGGWFWRLYIAEDDRRSQKSLAWERGPHDSIGNSTDESEKQEWSILKRAVFTILSRYSWIMPNT